MWHAYILSYMLIYRGCYPIRDTIKMRPLWNDMFWLIRIETQICNLSDITFRINFRKVWNLKRVQWKRGEVFQAYSNEMCHVTDNCVNVIFFHLLPVLSNQIVFLIHTPMYACLCLQTHTSLRRDINSSVLSLNSQLKYKNYEILMILTIVQMLKTLFRPNSACLSQHSLYRIYSIQMIFTQMG